MNGTPFGRYRLVELLGRGGMGEVWRAYDTGTDRVVALKVLPPDFAQDPVFAERFRREARAAAQLNNAHVISIHDYGEIDGRLFVDMRLIEGHDLQAELKTGPIHPARAVRIVEQIATALNAAHRIGLIHRDVKPSNILIDVDDLAYLIDFGIARAATDTGLTGTGTMIGTWAYMAPERFSSNQIDPRTDVYALACVLYQCLTGAEPFPGGTFERIATGHMLTPPPRPSQQNPGIPSAFDDVIAIGMAKDPNHRYPSTNDLAAAARNALTAPHARLAPTTTIRSEPTRPVSTPPPYPTHYDQSPYRRAESPRPLSTSQNGWRRRNVVLGATAVAIAIAVSITAVVLTNEEGTSPGTAKPSTTASSTQTQTSTPSLPTFGAQETVPFTDLSFVLALAVDGAGTVYLLESARGGAPEDCQVVMMAAGQNTQTVLPITGLKNSNGIAVDGAGTVYVSDYGGTATAGYGNNRVVALAAGATAPTTLPFDGLAKPWGVAVDGSGTVYVADHDNNRVLSLAAGATTQTELPFSGLGPAAIAVDAAGNVFVSGSNDSGAERIVELDHATRVQTTLPFTGVGKYVFGLAVDGGGIVYVADSENSQVVALAGATEQTVLPFTGLKTPYGVGIDSKGAVYVADEGTSKVVKLPAR